jgi:hypothetical protein
MSQKMAGEESYDAHKNQSRWEWESCLLLLRFFLSLLPLLLLFF